MALSLKDRVRSKLHLNVIDADDATTLGEVLHRSAKKSKTKKKKKKNQLDVQNQSPMYTPDGDISPLSPSSADLMNVLSKCPCENHHEKQMVERNYDILVDKLFDFLFGDNEFVRKYRQAQRIYDETATEWTMNDESKCRERVLNYKVPFESTWLGNSIIITREKQMLRHELPSSCYVIESEVCNEGVKWSDTFILCIRYCLVQTSVTTSNLRITAGLRFSKPVVGFIKQMIERNAYSASQEGFKDLNNRLNLVTNFTIAQRRSSRGEVTLPVPLPASARGRRMSRHDALSVIPTAASMPNDDNKLDSLHSSRFYPHDKVMVLFIFTVGTLLLIHLFLFIKLKHMESFVDILATLSSTMSHPSNKRRS